MIRKNKSQPSTKPSIIKILPVFKELFSPEIMERFIGGERCFYNRILTPLLLLWCFVYQRFNDDHTCDAVASHLINGGADPLDDSSATPVSQKIKSNSTAAFCKGRKRMPLSVIVGAVRYTAQVIGSYLGSDGLWLGHLVGLIDGTTILVRPSPELLMHYEPHKNQHGETYWIVLRVLAAFCLKTGVIMDAVEGSIRSSEQALTSQLFSRSERNTVHGGDRNFGVFSVMQAARH